MTTHSMEEAEVLCSRIGIVSRGTLKCIGTPQHLKRRFGQGYKIDIVVEEEKKSDANAFILSLVPKSALVAENGCYMSYQTDKDVRLSKVFGMMEINKKKHGIINWGLSQASLQEVFLTITKQDEGDDEAIVCLMRDTGPVIEKLKGNLCEILLSRLKSRLFDDDGRTILIEWIERALFSKVPLSKGTLIGLQGILKQIVEYQRGHQDRDRILKILEYITFIVEKLRGGEKNPVEGKEKKKQAYS